MNQLPWWEYATAAAFGTIVGRVLFDWLTRGKR